MRIGFVPSYYPGPDDPVRGHFFAKHVAALEREHEVHVITPPPFTRLPEFCRQVFLAVRRLRPDVLHAHVAVPGGVSAYIAGRAFGVPVALTEHAGPLSLLFERSALRRTLLARLYAAVDGLAIPSRTLDAELRSLGVRRDIAVIPNPVPDAMPRPDPVRGRFVAVGLMDDETKGFDHLLAGWAQSRRPREARLEVVGAGANEARYRAEVQRLGMTESVRFLGRREPRETLEIISRADCFISSSVYETFGYAPVEAAACGVPIIATRVGAMASFLDERSGVLVDPADPAGLAGAIESFLARRDAFDRAGIRQAARAAFGAEPVCRQTTRFLEVAMQSAR